MCLMSGKSKRVILITGASRGIGASLAEHFALRGDRVILNYRSSADAAAALRDRLGPESVLAVKADVSRRLQVRRMFDSAQEAFGGVDVLIHMAGVNRDAPFGEMTDAAWHEVVSVILTGTFICAQEFALRFKGGNGHIITVGSLSAVRGRKNGANYCSARAGVLALTKCLAQELAPRIRVNCVTPGYIGTDEVMTRYRLREKESLARVLDTIPLGRLGAPADVVRMMDFLVRESSYVTGQNFFVDGGTLMY